MRRKRRWVSLLLSLLLAMGLLAAPAAAEEKPYITQVAAGRPATLAVLSNGDVYAWGNNSLGLIDRSSRDGDFGWNAVLTPTKILSGVKSVDMGEDHILALKDDGTLWGMGCQDDGVLCNGQDLSGSQNALQNSMVQLTDDCIDMAASSHASYFVKSNGDLYACGSNIQSKLGIDYDQGSVILTPTKVDSGVRQVVAGEWNAYYVKNDNTVWSTGYADYGRRGFYDSNTYNGIDPIVGQVAISGEIKDISTSGRATVMLKADGTMWGFGSASSLGTEVERYSNPAKKFDSTFDWIDVPYVWDPIPCGLSAGSFAGQFGSAQ